jgi:hypothetical protein
MNTLTLAGEPERARAAEVDDDSEAGPGSAVGDQPRPRDRSLESARMPGLDEPKAADGQRCSEGPGETELLAGPLDEVITHYPA